MSEIVTTETSSRWGWLYELDRIIRGDATSSRELFRDSPKNADVRFPVGGILVVLGALGALYGMMMAVFAVVTGFETDSLYHAACQTTANIFKVPLLFFLAVVITFPSLYVFSAIVGSPIRIKSALRLLVAALAITISVLASLGPIVAFFSVSSPNYQFIVLLNVAVFAIAGVLGLRFLIQTLKKMEPVVVSATLAPPPAEVSADSMPLEVSLSNPASSDGNSSVPPTVPLVSRRGRISVVFWCWMIAFGLVGSQLGWILRPFIGCPSKPFELFREREGSFFQAVWNCLFNVLG